MRSAARSRAYKHLGDVGFVCFVSVRIVSRSPNVKWLYGDALSVNYTSQANDVSISADSNSVRCSSGITALRPSSVVSVGKRRKSNKCEELWRDLLLDPSQWWDNRSDKPNARFPDFKHKLTGEGLWLIHGRNPQWVASKIAFVTPGVSVFSWARKLSGFNKAGQYLKSMEQFELMRQAGVVVDSYVFVHVLNACAALHWLSEGKRIHQQIVEADCELDVHVGSSLVNMYAKCGSIDDAWKVFDRMPTRDVYAWTAMIRGCGKCNQGSKSLDLFHQMEKEGIQPTSVAFVGLLNACASTGSLEEGRRVHEQIVRSGFESDAYIGNSLVDMYSKCGSIDDALRVFDRMPTRNVVAWTAMIQGYVKSGEGQKALQLFRQMQENGVEPNSVTFVGLLNACACLGALEEGRLVHEHVIRGGFESDVYVGNSLVDMYAKCGSIAEAWTVFNKMPIRDVVARNAMILGCVKCAQPIKALEIFEQMQQDGVEPNSVTFLGLLNACASTAELEEGRRVHDQIVRSGLDSDVAISNSLVDMYAKCGSMGDAWKVFNKMPTLNVVSWTTMILGCVKCGESLNSLELFHQMQRKGIEPDPQTLVAVLNACARIAALEEGRRVHKQIIQRGWESDVYVGSSLVDMYAKCGSIEEARRVFNDVPTDNVVVWNAMIMGYAMHGLVKETVALFEQMSLAGPKMDDVTFTCLLSACSHGGLVKEGRQYFESMWSVYGVEPKVEHYTCMVDMLGRAGYLDDAEAIVKGMPLETCAAIWTSLLGACRLHGNVEMGEKASKSLLELDPASSAGYVLLSNLYVTAGSWDSQAMVQGERLRKHAMRQPGRTWIDVNNEVHSFVVNDSEHPQIRKILEELKRLSQDMKDAGYVPDTRFALHGIEEEIMLEDLSRHSEKLAIAFGLISTPAGSPLCIVKNLPVCGDCHTATKFISKIVGRAITIRDGNRFHHFKDGLCSCGDYW